jgi:hypothetical protein
MSIKQELKDTTEKLRLLSLYQRFEHIVIMILTALSAVIVIAAVWNLSLKILFGLVLSGSLDPSDYTIFQAVFGVIFTVIIALEFKKSLLVTAERRESVVQIRSVVMIAPLAICPQSRHSRSEGNRCAATLRARGRDPCPRRCLLADVRQRSAPQGCKLRIPSRTLICC